ncbi:MAG: hypothetical protein AAFV43_16565, partial [Planctomycetota bacterium]
MPPPKSRPAKATTQATKRTKAASSAPEKKPAKKYTDELELLASLPQPHDHAYEYRLPDGTLVGLVIRWNATADTPKRIVQARRNDDGTWSFGGIPTPAPLYRLGEFSKADGRVFVVEGEKAADALADLGELATTWPGGANKPDGAEWSPLFGRDVVLVADNDEPGRKAMRIVATLLGGGVNERSENPVIQALTLTTLTDGSPFPEKGDVVDWLEAGGDIATLRALADAAPTAEPMVAKPAAKLVDAADGDLPEAAPPRQPFPVDSLPASFAKFVREAADVMQVDASMLGVPALVGAAAAIGATR